MAADLRDRVALVTGACRVDGLGAGIAAELVQHGATVVVADVDLGQAEAVLEATGAEAALPLDVTAAAMVERSFDQIARQFGKLDILVNNAGLGAGDDDGGWSLTFEVNVRGVVRCCERALRLMQPRGYGKIVNLASIAGHNASNPTGSYGASKAALLRYTSGLAVEQGRYGVNVNAVCPGGVWTELQRREFARPERIDPSLKGLSPYDAFVRHYAARSPLGRVQDRSDIGKAVAFLASDDAAFITGRCLHVDGGIVQ